ncbi:hypothetical protein, partial [Lysinibacillus sphaericus]|uniref:hypothetical protein n=1 Tax=Lysinibacillus sphaericus TaxID=1421 RepID=UPI001CBD9583
GENKILLIVASSSSFNLESLVYKKYLQLAHSFSSVLTTGTILQSSSSKASVTPISTPEYKKANIVTIIHE